MNITNVYICSEALSITLDNVQEQFQELSPTTMVTINLEQPENLEFSL